MICPVTNAEASEEKNITGPTTSLGSAILPSGIRSRSWSRNVRILHHVADHLGVNEGGRHAVDRDSVPGQLHGVLLDEHDQAALGAAISGIAPVAQSELGTYG